MNIPKYVIEYNFPKKDFRDCKWFNMRFCKDMYSYRYLQIEYTYGDGYTYFIDIRYHIDDFVIIEVKI